MILGQITTIERAYFYYFGKPEPAQVEAEIAADSIRMGPKKALAVALQGHRTHSRWAQDGIYDPALAALRSRHARTQIEKARRFNAGLAELIENLGEVPAKLKMGFANIETNAFCNDFFLGFIHGQGEVPAPVERRAPQLEEAV
ncbi:hypothetical protein [Labrys monachus]|uniref:Uncharacterized protein n=1 Tax=Labrys monachus TaxID=217067 RepID=A0ABU0FHD9_9HYPH|nr:hypothetical protein [Labrys monachus]MDQ0393936.1 hypothetical protein [Labrys monachus]